MACYGRLREESQGAVQYPSLTLSVPTALTQLMHAVNISIFDDTTGHIPISGGGAFIAGQPPGPNYIPNPDHLQPINENLEVHEVKNADQPTQNSLK